MIINKAMTLARTGSCFSLLRRATTANSLLGFRSEVRSCQERSYKNFGHHKKHRMKIPLIFLLLPAFFVVKVIDWEYLKLKYLRKVDAAELMSEEQENDEESSAREITENEEQQDQKRKKSKKEKNTFRDRKVEQSN